ncbi:hypothetical protein BLOT_012202 [Blomia tropicalis]|nr:hypothetical protein BLOT_012202 [Blomia tropicalis]
MELKMSAWRSNDCPIDSPDNRGLCIRPCDYDEYDHRNGKNTSPPSNFDKEKDNFFVVFFPPKNQRYETERLRCPLGYRQTWESRKCFCERSFTSYEMELQRRERCDQAFERCRMYGTKAYDCNHIIDSCPTRMIREYCIGGKVYKMRFAAVLYEFCHSFLRLSNDRRVIEPEITMYKTKQ